MEIRIFDDMSQCTETEVRRLLPLVSAQRREQALKFRHTFGQFACLKSYVVLSEMLGFKPEFDYNEHGKPFIRFFGSPFFSISHCREAIAVVVSDEPVGIDAESIRDVSEALIDKTMNPTEAADIRSAEDMAERFTEYWTRKEAVLKLRGTGITDDLHGVLEGRLEIGDRRLETETHINMEKGYVWSLAVPLQ